METSSKKPSKSIALAVVTGLVMLRPGVGLAEFLAFTDRTAWEAAVGAVTATEDFNGFAVDMLDVPAPVALNGMTVQSVAGTDFNFAIDVPPYFSPLQGIDGTPKASGRVSDSASFNETWRIDFSIPVSAWGADFRNAGDPPAGNLMIDVFGDSLVEPHEVLLGTLTADASADIEFLGFQSIIGELANYLVFSAPGGIDGFDIDNISLVQVPEPSASLGGIGVVAILGLGRVSRKGRLRAGSRSTRDLRPLTKERSLQAT